MWSGGFCKCEHYILKEGTNFKRFEKQKLSNGFGQLQATYLLKIVEYEAKHDVESALWSLYI